MKFTAVLRSVAVEDDRQGRFQLLAVDPQDATDAICVAVRAARKLVVYRVERVETSAEFAPPFLA